MYVDFPHICCIHLRIDNSKGDTGALQYTHGMCPNVVSAGDNRLREMAGSGDSAWQWRTLALSASHVRAVTAWHPLCGLCCIECSNGIHGVSDPRRFVWSDWCIETPRDCQAFCKLTLFVLSARASQDMIISIACSTVPPVFLG